MTSIIDDDIIPHSRWAQSSAARTRNIILTVTIVVAFACALILILWWPRHKREAVPQHPLYIPPQHAPRNGDVMELREHYAPVLPAKTHAPPRHTEYYAPPSQFMAHHTRGPVIASHGGTGVAAPNALQNASAVSAGRSDAVIPGAMVPPQPAGVATSRFLFSKWRRKSNQEQNQTGGSNV